MSGRVIGALVAVCLLAAVGQAQETDAERQARRESLRNGPKVQARQVSGKPEGTGTVQYDPGGPPDALLSNASATYLFGNLFNSQSGSPLNSGTITGLSWYQGALPSAVPVLAPFSASPIFAVLAVGTASTFNSINVSVAVPGSFFGGVAAPTGTAFASVGMRSASTNGQGFHGLQRDFYGGVILPMPTTNVMFRVSGNIIIPVELLEFEVD